MTNNSANLLATLDQAIARDVCPYFEAISMTYASGLSSYDGYLKPCRLIQKPFTSITNDFFWWVHRFISDEAILEIGYGDREFIVEAMIFYPSIQNRFAPWELLTANKIAKPQAISGNAWVVSSDFMEKTIFEMSNDIKAYWPLLSRPDPVIIDRVKKLRDSRQIVYQKDQRRKDREKASIQASRAFHENQFKRAIDFLAPFRGDEALSRSSKMLLRIAEEKQKYC